jgi:hypothetical protein
MGVTNFDLNRWGEMMGWSDVERKLLDEREADTTGTTNRRLSADIFKYTEGNDPYDLLDEDEASLPSSEEDGDAVQRNLGRKKADIFAASINKDTSAPIIRSTFPPVNTKIGPNQSFGALVSDTGTGVKSVCLQLRDHINSLSDCFELVNVGYDVYELTFDGFDAYEGETWSYRIRSKDGAKNRVNTQWADFIINISGKQGGNEEEGQEENGDNGQGSGGEDQGGQGSGVLSQEVRDESWPYGGVIQKSTGRILFFFDGNAYVCTGTVLDDEIEDRTVIVSSHLVHLLLSVASLMLLFTYLALRFSKSISTAYRSTLRLSIST